MPDDLPDVLTMERVTKVYGTGDAAVKALDDVDFEANVGEVTVIIRTARPGVIIGRKGAKVDKLKDDLAKITRKTVDEEAERLEARKRDE